MSESTLWQPVHACIEPGCPVVLIEIPRGHELTADEGRVLEEKRRLLPRCADHQMAEWQREQAAREGTAV